MKKAILGAVAAVVLGGTLVYANIGTPTKNSKGICPDRPGCICSPNEKCVMPQTEKGSSATCPDFPGCVCSK